MAKTKTTYRCGNCNQEGHNARSCPDKGTADAPETVTPEEVNVAEEPKASPTLEAEPTPEPEHPSGDLVSKSRTGSTPSSPGCFECPACQKIGVLVLVTVDDGTQHDVMRCEYCHTQVTALAIAKWGAHPSDAPRVSR